MAIGAVRFAGKDLYKPQTAVDRKFVPFAAGGASASRCIIVGTSTKGIPYNAADKDVQERINGISNLDEAKQQLGTGVGYECVKLALDPAPDAPGASEVQFIRVNPATHATATVVDVDDGTCLDLTTTEYGLVADQVNFKIEAGGVAPSKKITVRFGDDIVVTDDITLESFTMEYTGAATICILTIDPDGNLTTTTATASVPADDLTISLATYTTMADLVSFIDSQDNYTATLLAGATTLTAELDEVLVGDGIDLAAEKTIYSELQACIDWFNESSDYITAVLTSGADRRKLKVQPTSGWTYMDGAIDGNADATAWAASITHGQLFDASFRHVATGTGAYHSALAASIVYLSGVGGRNECQGFVGASDSDSKSVRIAAAKVLGGSGMDYFGDTIYRYDDNGVVTEYDGFYAAAAFMGYKAGAAITEPGTYKKLKAIKLKATHTATDIRDYIQGGVIIMEEAPEGGFRVIRGITTSTTNNLAEVEDSMQRTARYVSKHMRQSLEAVFIGKPGDALTIQSIEAHARLLLDDYENKFKFFVNDPALGNAYRSFSLIVTGSTFRIQFEATLVAPINFILITQNFTVVGATR